MLLPDSGENHQPGLILNNVLKCGTVGICHQKKKKKVNCGPELDESKLVV